MAPERNPAWTWIAPLLAWALLGASKLVPMLAPLGAGGLLTGVLLPVALALALGGAVFAGVHHAEIVAARVGEPFGTLVLAVAVTVIEVGLVLSIMLSAAPGDPASAALPRDTVFAAVMIICNGVVGACLLAGGVRHRLQEFQLQGATGALAVLAALAALTLALPNYTSTVPGPSYSRSQLLFAGAVSLALYAVFVFVQTVRHPGDFLTGGPGTGAHAFARPAGRTVLASSVLLVASLVAVVLLAKALAPLVEAGIDRIGAPKAAVGVVIAAVVLLPESIAAIRAARADDLQTSLNLALGSALASIGLTIPAVAVYAVLAERNLVLGLDAKGIALLALTLLVSVLTLGTGRTTVLQGAVHLVIFAAFLFLSVVP